MRQDNAIYTFSIKLSFPSKGQNKSKLQKQISNILILFRFTLVSLIIIIIIIIIIINFNVFSGINVINVGSCCFLSLLFLLEQKLIFYGPLVATTNGLSAPEYLF